MTIGQRIKLVLDIKGWKQCELAEAMNTTEVSVSRYISDKRIPRTYELIKLCKALNVSADWILGLKEK